MFPCLNSQPSHPCCVNNVQVALRGGKEDGEGQRAGREGEKDFWTDRQLACPSWRACLKKKNSQLLPSTSTQSTFRTIFDIRGGCEEVINKTDMQQGKISNKKMNKIKGMNRNGRPLDV